MRENSLTFRGHVGGRWAQVLRANYADRESIVLHLMFNDTSAVRLCQHYPAAVNVASTARSGPHCSISSASQLPQRVRYRMQAAVADCVVMW